MATIAFSNGMKVQFNGNPTPQDVEEVANKLGLQGNKPTGLLDQIGNAGKSIGDAFTNFIFPQAFQKSIAGSAFENASQYRADQVAGTRPTDLQAAGGALQGALNFGSLAMPMAGSALGRVAQAGGLGAGFGTAGALQGQNPTPGSVLQGALTGGAVGLGTGGALEGVGALSNAFFNKLPQGVIRSAVPSKGADVSETILNSPIEKLQTKLETAANRVAEYADNVDSILKSPRYTPGTSAWEDLIAKNPKLPIASEGIEKSSLLTKVAAEFGRRGGSGTITGDEVEKILNSQIPAARGYLSNDYITPAQMNEIGRIINVDKPKMYNLDRVGTFNEKVLKSFATIARNTVKKIAPETVPLLAEQAISIPERNALSRLLQRNADKGFSIGGFQKGMAAVGGALLGGAPGAAAGYGIENLIENPTAQVVGSQLLNRIGRPSQFIGSTVRPAAQVGLLNALINRPRVNQF